MKDDFVVIPGEDPTVEDWQGGKVGEGSILGEFFRLFRVKKNYCGRCKCKLERRDDGSKWCPNCGSTVINDGSFVAPE